MGRQQAIAVLTGFALLFSFVSYFGFSEVSKFLDVIARCEMPAVIDYSSLWFGGFFCFGILPLMAFTLSRRMHWVALIAMLLIFFCVPAILHNRVVHSAESGGYDVSSDPGLFTLVEVEFADAVCG